MTAELLDELFVGIGLETLPELLQSLAYLAASSRGIGRLEMLEASRGLRIVIIE